MYNPEPGFPKQGRLARLGLCSARDQGAAGHRRLGPGAFLRLTLADIKMLMPTPNCRQAGRPAHHWYCGSTASADPSQGARWLPGAQGVARHRGTAK